jgi:hypothetical protein
MFQENLMKTQESSPAWFPQATLTLHQRSSRNKTYATLDGHHVVGRYALTSVSTVSLPSTMRDSFHYHPGGRHRPGSIEPTENRPLPASGSSPRATTSRQLVLQPCVKWHPFHPFAARWSIPRTVKSDIQGDQHAGSSRHPSGEAEPPT